MNAELLESIGKMTVNGNRLELPSEQIDNYPAVKKCLLAAGGKYKKNGFIFTDSAEEVQARLLDGEAVNDKKKYQFFATPEAIAKKMVQDALIEPHHLCLEPSAGQGAIAEKMDAISLHPVMCVELMPQNVKVLLRKGLDWTVERDYLSIDAEKMNEYFDRIVANPPFTKNQDIDHIRKMYTHLKPGGRMVSLASPSWTFGSQKKQQDFRVWLQELDHTVIELEEGAFKESGTNIRTMMITIDKPEN